MLEAGLGALAVLLIFLIGSRLFGRRAGLLAAAIGAVFPPLILAGSSLLSESLFIPLVLAAVWTGLNARDSSQHALRWAVASGALVGLAGLTRGNGLPLVIPAAFLVWVERPRFARRAVRAPLALLAATIVVLAPWASRDYNVFGQFVPVTTETGFALAGTYNSTAQARHDFPSLWMAPGAQIHEAFAADPTANEAGISGDLTRTALHYLRTHPGSLFKTIYWNALRLLNLTGTRVERAFAGGEGYPAGLAIASVYAFWVVLALAIAGALTRAVRGAPAAVWWFPGVILLAASVLLGLTRYRTPADPFFVLLAALGCVSLARRGRATLAPRFVPARNRGSTR